MRLEPAGPTGERLDALILRTEFTNQVVFRVYESAALDAAQTQAIASADLTTVELADRADGVFDLDMLPKYLDEAEAALNAKIGRWGRAKRYFSASMTSMPAMASALLFCVRTCC